MLILNGDGIDDGTEVAHGSDPLSPSTVSALGTLGMVLGIALIVILAVGGVIFFYMKRYRPHVYYEEGLEENNQPTTPPPPATVPSHGIYSALPEDDFYESDAQNILTQPSARISSSSEPITFFFRLYDVLLPEKL